MKIKNINLKLIAGLSAFVIATTTITGCSVVSIEDIEYVKNESGIVEGLSESVSYDTLKYCSFCKVYNYKTDEEYYTIALIDDWNPDFYVAYHDIFTKQKLTYDTFSFKTSSSVTEYIAKNNLVKDGYQENELRNILNGFVSSIQKNKQKSKE